MQKNINNCVRNWKNNQQTYTSNNNVTINSASRFPQSNIYQHIITPKNVKPLPTRKGPTIQRYYSEQDFNRKGFLKQPHYAQSSTKVQEQYFPNQPLPTQKTNKPVRSISKPNKPKQYKEKSTLEAINFRINGLKQTSSTQSAQNLPKRIPFYVKNKFKTQTHNHNHQQYSWKRLSTPRYTIRRQNFKIISKLGQGKFGKVFMVKQLYSGFILSMKIVEKKKIISDNLLEQFIRQLKIQTFLNHPNIISLYGFFSDDTHFYTLMQLGCNGQLYSLILNKKLLSEQSTSFIIKNLLQAISYIHDNKVLHRDIKPQNIVLIMGNVKICDFGWAVNKIHPAQLRNTFCGTPLYLSPQILQGSHYDEKVDLWAIGILTYQLHLGCNPFDITTHEDLQKIVPISQPQFTQTITFPSNTYISSQFKQFILAILTKNPQERSTSKKLLNMEFINKYRDFQTCEEICR